MRWNKVWDLLQTAYDRRQWLANGDKPSSPDSEKNWPTISAVAAGLGENKGSVSRVIGKGLRDNGKSGSERRIDPASVLEHCEAKGVTYNVGCDDG